MQRTTSIGIPIYLRSVTIGRERKIAVEKKQAEYQSQVTTGKHQVDQLLVPGD